MQPVLSCQYPVGENAGNPVNSCPGNADVCVMPPRKNTRPARRDSRSREGSGKGSTTFLLLILVILAAIVVILGFREPLARLVTQASPGEATATPAPETPSPVTPSPTPAATVSATTPKPTPAARTPRPSSTPRPTAHSDSITVDGGKPSPSPTPVPATSSSAHRELRNANLYLVHVDATGRLMTEKVVRKIDYGDSPLQNSIASLLRGPTAEEINQGYVTLIPQGTRLLSAWVRDGIAYLSFSENFMFNPMGADGLHAQIRQVGLVALEFPTVQKVQILIDGKKTEYLGGDNVYVGEPFSRKDLQ